MLPSEETGGREGPAPVPGPPAGHWIHRLLLHVLTQPGPQVCTVTPFTSGPGAASTCFLHGLLPQVSHCSRQTLRLPWPGTCSQKCFRTPLCASVAAQVNFVGSSDHSTRSRPFEPAQRLRGAGQDPVCQRHSCSVQSILNRNTGDFGNFSNPKRANARMNSLNSGQVQLKSSGGQWWTAPPESHTCLF